jgi:DNA-binding NtrC family response regulator
MSTIVVLAVCLDQFFPGAEASTWKSAGYFFVPAPSIKEAIKHFKAGDFDLVLLGHSIPVESRERLTYLIRATASHVPVVCIAGSLGQQDSFADATFAQGSTDLFTGMGELLKGYTRVRAVPAILYATAT